MNGTAGGSIIIKAKYLYLSGASFVARGGRGGEFASGFKGVGGGGGAGGRVKIFYEKNISPLSYSTDVRGGAGGGWMWNNLIGAEGESGTVYVERIAWNEAPTAYIDSIAPNPAVQGQSVNFAGHGIDSDGTVTAYEWKSSIDGMLSTQFDFNKSHKYSSLPEQLKHKVIADLTSGASNLLRYESTLPRIAGIFKYSFT